MISEKGFSFLKKTNEDGSAGSTSKPGPSSETQDESQNDQGGVASSCPAAPESSQVESLFYRERSKSKCTHSFPHIPNSEVPISIRGSWRDILSDLKRGGEGNDKQNGGEEGDQRNGGEGNDRQNGGEEGDQRNGGEGNDQQNGGEEGDRRSGGEERVQLFIGQLRTDRWSRFKKSYFNCARWIINSACVNFLLTFIVWLTIVTVYIGWLHSDQCPPLPGMTTALVIVGVILSCFWFCCKGFTDRYICRRCWNWDKYLLLAPFAFLVVFFIVEFVYFVSVKCDGPFFDFAIFFQIVFILCLLFAIGVYFPDMYASLRTEERIPLRSAIHEEEQNEDEHQSEPEEQV